MDENKMTIFTIPVSKYSLLSLLEKQRDISKEDFWNNIFDRYDEFVSDIKELLNSLFPLKHSINKYTNEFLANQIFKIEVAEKDVKSLYKYSIIAILKELEWLKEELVRYQEIEYNSVVFSGEINYLWNIFFSIQEFVEIVQSYIKHIDCRHHVSRRTISSNEIMYLARRMPRNELFINDISQGPVSIFLIRQGIELRIIEILGIISINNRKDNSMVKVPPDKLLDILKNPQIKLPIEYSIIKKIHSWTNLYVHRAKIHDYWEMEWAIKTIQPFIFDKTQIKKSYESQLKTDVYVALGDVERKRYDIHFCKPNVEWCEELSSNLFPPCDE